MGGLLFGYDWVVIGGVRSFEKAAKGANIVIGEVGAWSNPISSDKKARKETIKKFKDSLSLAEMCGVSE